MKDGEDPKGIQTDDFRVEALSRREFLKIATVAGAVVGLGGGMGALLAACAGTSGETTIAGGATSSRAVGARAYTTSPVDPGTLANPVPIGRAIPPPSTGGAWELKPFVAPKLPAQIPATNSIDPATGLHVNGRPQEIDPATYRLRVSGKVTRNLSLSYDDLRRLPKMTASPDLVCVGNFIDKATWSGVSLKLVLEMAGLAPEAQQITMSAADGWSATVNRNDALKPDNFLIYELEGQPLPALHGFPVRAGVPSLSGYRWVKWLVAITVD